MPRTQLHPASLALGIVLASLCFVSMSQITMTTPLRIEFTPHPRDMVQIQEGVPFNVPSARVFVLTGLGAVTNSGFSTLSVNGQPEAQVYLGAPTTAPSMMVAMPPGFTAAGGSMITVTNGASTANEGRAWGYLVNP